MLAPNRRRERRADVLDALRSEHGYRISRVLDLTTLETGGGFLEGTGSVVLDRTNRVAYACLSPRTRADSLAAFGRELGYDSLAFDAADADGRSIYHTNVAAIYRHAFRCRFALAHWAPIGCECWTGSRASGREIVDLTFRAARGIRGATCSSCAGRDSVIALVAGRRFDSLGTRAARTLEGHGELVIADVGTIESYGGGQRSAACSRRSRSRGLRDPERATP
jgi:hypothetical protein